MMKKMLTVAVTAGFCGIGLAASLVLPAIPLPTIPDRVFKITDYGAVADGKTLNTEALRKAVAACRAAGGGKVVVPAGEFIAGPFEFASNMELRLEKNAVLRFSDRLELYGAQPTASSDPDDAKLKAPITGAGLVNIAITGAGVIDGNGKAWWARSGKKAWANGAGGEMLPRPNLIEFTRCTNVLFEEVTVCNSPQFHIVPHYCDGVTCRDLKIVAPSNSPNTDGIDPSNSRNVLITRCVIDDGDDNISFKARRDANNKNTVPTENVYVTDCTFLHGHGVSVGSRVWSGIRNIVVDNCTFEGTAIGIRIKSARGRGGLMENITYSNIKMKDVGTAVTINMYYFDRLEGAQPVTPETPIVRNVKLQNISVAGARTAGDITGLPEMPVTDIKLENADIAAETGMRIRDAREVEFKAVKIKAGTGKPLTVEKATVRGIENFGDTTPDAVKSKRKR